MYTFIIRRNKLQGVKVNLEIYPLSAVFAAAYILLNEAYIYLDKYKNNIIVFFIPKNRKNSFRDIYLKFYTQLLNYTHYYWRVQEDKDNINMLLQRAFVSAAPSILKEAEEKEIESLIKKLDKEVNE